MATTADYLNKLVGQKNTLADNLTAKGVTAAHSETLETLVPKVLEINGGETTGYISDGLICFSELTDEIVYNPTADGKIGRNVNNCDGTNGYVSAKRTGIVGQMSSAFTIQALCRTTVSSSTIKFIFGVMYDVSFNTAMLMVKDGCFGLERSNGQIMSTVAVNNDEWHMVTAAYDGTTMRLYVDGANVADYTGTWAIPEDATIRVGNWNGSINDFCFAGNIANVCIYNRCLSDTEIAQNWQTDVNRYGIGG